MSLLQLPTTDDATAEVKEIFEEIQAAFGIVPNALRQWAVNPRALRVQWNDIKITLSKDKENQKLHTMVRYLVSGESQCKYCTGFNGGMLINMFGMTQDEVVALQKDYTTAPLDAKNKALLLLAMESIKNPDSVNEKDIKGLKERGISEVEMFDIVHAAGHMLSVNTIFKTFKLLSD